MDLCDAAGQVLPTLPDPGDPEGARQVYEEHGIDTRVIGLVSWSQLCSLDIARPAACETGSLKPLTWSAFAGDTDECRAGSAPFVGASADRCVIGKVCFLGTGALKKGSDAADAGLRLGGPRTFMTRARTEKRDVELRYQHKQCSHRRQINVRRGDVDIQEERASFTYCI